MRLVAAALAALLPLAFAQAAPEAVDDDDPTTETVQPINALAGTVTPDVTVELFIDSPPEKEVQLELDVPPSADAIPMLPPLSIEECVAGLKMIEARLANPEIGMDRWHPKETGRVFEYLQDYIALTDRKHSTLGNYTWNYMGENKVAPGVTDRDSFYVAPALAHVSAISFVATDGNVEMEKIEVVDVSNQRIEIPVKKRLIEGLPRREVVSLFLPVTIKEVVAYYKALDGEPRVTIYGGISRRPEHLKAAQHYLRVAQQAIADGRREPARQAIVDAEKHLSHFLRR